MLLTISRIVLYNNSGYGYCRLIMIGLFIIFKSTCSTLSLLFIFLLITWLCNLAGKLLTYSDSLVPTHHSQPIIHYQLVKEVINKIENRLCYQLIMGQMSYFYTPSCCIVTSFGISKLFPEFSSVTLYVIT
jgi:hypothetical protein